MDQIDISLLQILQEDARITVSDLSKRLSLSRPSITERLHRLQEKGIIEGFSARVSPAAIGRNTLLIIQITDLKVPASQWEKMITLEKDVLECHRVTGHIGYIIKAAVSGMDGLRDLVDRLMNYSNHVNTSIVLTSPVGYRPILPNQETDSAG
ncbi:Lrp/AsnC family leucine-responsive transcriptional regulator [Paenibacillus phyllosphaerae]|uniref:Lrp/AsnC family leucine-responsive transcriptional regulator n=1 Tax=Paenibacillus phyllosphaerae TaxID=274593 RepID=A0A7W5B0Y8_9BACL|nr:Lrp/AsnC family transcriptional regulator [Paenibacillus phyllosphaerae]MBB3112387.1 Lrp/AsnC family leucine-responsive transcriptional regulator [Paenibacillus phyllosphaerae]